MSMSTIADWRKSTWGEEISLEYGKALRDYDTDGGNYRVFGSNGPIGWHSDYLVPGPGVILGRKGAYRGVEFSRDPFWVIDTAYYVVPKTELDHRWLYYAIKHYKLGEIDDGSPIPSTTRAAVYVKELQVPPAREQRAIAHILGTLDDKIELNRKRCRTLEAMARAIFQSWFVDFDPVYDNARRRGTDTSRRHADTSRRHADTSRRRQSSGDDRENDPSTRVDGSKEFCLSPELAALFPDRFEDSPLGPIPAGWRVGTVGNNFRITMGQSPPGNTYNEIGDGIPFYQGRTDFGFRFPNRRVYCTAPTRLAQTGDTLVSVRAPVGDVNIALEVCAIGRGVAAVRHVSGSRSLTYYAMYNLRDHFNTFEAEGTVFGSINKADFAKLPFVEPTVAIVDAFERVVGRIDDQVETLERENVTLAALRDALLPKLISGELRVPDAERIVGRCV